MEQKDTSGEENLSALEQFRQQWRQEVSERSKQSDKKPNQPRRSTGESSARPERPINKPPGRHPLADAKDDDHDGSDETKTPRSSMIERIEGLRIKDMDEDEFSGASTKEPSSALEHYERAVEKESQGNLGDSLAHYRKAYRLDAKVDQTYKSKHFANKPKPSQPNLSIAPATASDPAHHSSEAGTVLSFQELIPSFAKSEILNAPPIIEGDVPPPCPIKRLPIEVLIDVLEHVAVRDPAIYSRLGLVCKRLAYHVFSESHVWKRVALGPQFGVTGQQYKFATDLQGREAIFQELADDEDSEEEAKLPPITEALFPKSTDWREFFHVNPRIRYTGVYISTVNYTRAGGASATPGAWHTRVHIVTYYRYLRFFRDGTLISLLTTYEPVEVVHQLTKENLQLVRAGGKHLPQPGSNLPIQPGGEGQSLPATTQNVMKNALRGRWRLCHPSLDESTSGSVVGANVGFAGDVHIETEGIGPRYMYTLHLSIKSGSKSKTAVKNNKLVWKGFWSYNHLTDDWSEFQLKNDKAFWFSRVKSYGLGY